MPNPTNRTEADREPQRADSDKMAPKQPPTEATPVQSPQASKPLDPAKNPSAKPDEGARSRAAAEQRDK